MSDEIDMACEREQKDREIAIKLARQQATPIYHTHCKFCGDPTEDGRRFCSYGQESCATESSWYERTLKRTGVPR